MLLLRPLLSRDELHSAFVSVVPMQQIATLNRNILSPPVNLSQINRSLWTAQASRDGAGVAVAFFQTCAVSTPALALSIPHTDAAVNITQMRASLAALNASIWSASIVTPPSVLASLSALSPTVTALNAQLAAALVALDVFSGTQKCLGVNISCSVRGSTALPCSPGAPCTPAMRYCQIDGSTPCTGSADCPLSTACAYNGPTFAATTAALTAYGSSSGADQAVSGLSPIVVAMGSATASLLAVPSLSSFSSQLVSAQMSLSSVPVASSLSAIASLQAQLDPSSLGLGPTSSSIATAKSAFNTASGQLGGVRGQLVSFNSSIASVKSQANSLGNLAVQFCNAMSSYFSTTVRSVHCWRGALQYHVARRRISNAVQLPANLRAMNSTNIAAAKQARGIAGPLLVLGGVVNDAIAVLGSATNGSTSLSLNAASLANSVAAYTDVLHNASFASHGPLYFFAKLAGLSNLVEPSEADAGGGVFVSATGKAWSGNRVCLADTCVSNTVIAANRGPLSVAAITGGSGGPSISVSRETLFFLPYLIPVIRE